MPIQDILSAGPYYAKHDESDNRLQVLFRPGYAVQSRELVELQSILQSQISTLSSRVFSDGSRVVGGEVVKKIVRFYKLDPTFYGTEVDVSTWVGRRLSESIGGSPSGMTGVVVAVLSATSDNPHTVYVEHDRESPKEGFDPGAALFADGVESGATVSTEDGAIGTTMHVGIDSGVFSIEGRFVHVDGALVLASAYDPAPTGRLGIQYSEHVVTPRDDDTLRDPAKGSPNYSAPGADRLKITARVVFVVEGDDEPDQFVVVAEFVDGTIKSETNGTIYSDIGRELARRTHEESGNYTISPFDAFFDDHVGVMVTDISVIGGGLSHRAVVRTSRDHGMSKGDSVVVTGVEGFSADSYNGTHVVDNVKSSNEIEIALESAPIDPASGGNIVIKSTDMMTATMGPGKAYVTGFEIEKGSNDNVGVRRARDTSVYRGYATPAPRGVTITVENWSGPVSPSGHPEIRFIDSSGSEVANGRVMHVDVHDQKMVIHCYNLSANDGGGVSMARTVEVDGEVADVSSASIDGIGKTRLGGGKGQGFIVQIPEEHVRTTTPFNVPSVDIVHTITRSVTVSSGGTASFTVAPGQYVTGPFDVEFSGTPESMEHTFMDDEGVMVVPSSMMVKSGGRELVVVFPRADFVVSANLSIRSTGVESRTKVLRTETITHPYSSTADGYSLLMADVVSLRSVTTSDGRDFVDHFVVDGGQRDDHYDHGSAKVSRGIDLQDGEILTFVFDRYEHAGSGYFSVDSYSGLEPENIPKYKTQNSGAVMVLRDCLDFRPTRADASTSHVGSLVPRPGTNIVADFDFYMPRRDRVVLDSTGDFRVIQGESSLNPTLPSEPDGSMTLFETYVPAYTSNPSDDVQIKFVDNRRYTMRDIGRIDRRVDRLEKYTSLSMLEMETRSTSVTDSDGYDRFKNGFLVDDFSGHGVGDVTNPDYACSIDFESRELRPPFVSRNIPLSYSTESSGVAQVGSEDVGVMATIPHTETPFVDHVVATKAVSVNPYLVIREDGVLECNPSSDDWVDTSRTPAVKVDLTGDQSAWRFMTRAVAEGIAPGFGTRWNDWQTTWAGVTASTDSDVDRRQFRALGRDLVETRVNRTTTTSTTRNQVRRGERATLGFDTISKSVGDRVVDVNLAPFMRPIDIRLTGKNMRPNTDLHVFVDDSKVNEHTRPLDARYSPVGEGVIRTDERGEVRAILSIPEGTFRTGERDIVLIDESNKIVENARTYSAHTFVSSGLINTKQDAIVSTRAPTMSSREIVERRTVVDTAVETITSVTVNATGRRDPLAQTFFVAPQVHPHGVFAHSVDLFFKRKPSDDAAPVEIQIRPVVNGFPHSSKILPLSSTIIQPSEVSIPANTDDMASVMSAPTRVRFVAPIHLSAGKEYAIVVISDSSEYECYVAEMGQRILGSRSVVSKQPSLGSLFKSQNSSTWTPTQNEDLAMRLNRCKFDVNRTTTLVCSGDEDARCNVAMLSNETLSFEPVATITDEVRMAKSSSGDLGEWRNLPRGTNVTLEEEMIVNSDHQMTTRTTLRTTRDDVAPIVDLTRNSMIVVENVVNDYGLTRDSLTIVESGEGYTTATIESSGGSGATLKPIIRDGKIVDVDVIGEGRGFVDESVITVIGDGSGAVIKHTSTESSPNGGNCRARYMTRRTVLADEWESDYATVTLDAYKPGGTDVHAYCKVLSSDDPASFDERPWTRMELVGQDVTSGNPDDIKEISFVPAGGSLGYSSGGTTFDTIKVMAVKIVPVSGNTSVVPRIRDLRVIWAAP